MDDAASWQSFYATAGAAAAALTGLIFVAVTLHTSSIVNSALHRDRAWASVVLLMSLLFIALAVLVPARSRPITGLLIDPIGAFWVYRTLWFTRALSSARRDSDRPRVRWQIEWFVWIAWLVVLVAGSLSLTFDWPVGFFLLAVAMAGMFGFGIWSAWVLISEVSD